MPMLSKNNEARNRLPARFLALGAPSHGDGSPRRTLGIGRVKTLCAAGSVCYASADKQFPAFRRDGTRTTRGRHHACQRHTR
jgi:hypothetical protein